jgi:hypothetical protein
MVTITVLDGLRCCRDRSRCSAETVERTRRGAPMKGWSNRRAKTHLRVLPDVRCRCPGDRASKFPTEIHGRGQHESWVRHCAALRKSSVERSADGG